MLPLTFRSTIGRTKTESNWIEARDFGIQELLHSRSFRTLWLLQRTTCGKMEWPWLGKQEGVELARSFDARFWEAGNENNLPINVTMDAWPRPVL